jgi:hypothetical protein
MSTVPDVDFEKLIALVQTPANYVGAEKLAIWGGECAADQLLAQLHTWQMPNAAMPFCFWETIRAARFEKQTLPSDPADLERGRMFGAGGDLTLRRADDVFLWYFIGELDTARAAGFQTPSKNFFAPEAEPNARFLREESSALLWGDRKPNQARWFEDRVARAELVYPTDVPDAQKTWRMRLHYTTYSRAGQIEFVWYTKLEAEKVKEASNGKG